MELTIGTAERIEQLPRHLMAEFPEVSSVEIEHDVEEVVRTADRPCAVRRLRAVVVDKTVRERLRDTSEPRGLQRSERSLKTSAGA